MGKKVMKRRNIILSRQIGTKRKCSRCHEIKDESEFRFNDCAGWYDAYCMECRRAYLREYYIKDYLKERGVDERSTEPLFTHIRGDKTKVLDTEGLYASIKTIARRAGMDKRVYPHLFRKTTATNICRRGGSEDAAGEYLGHAPKSVTGKHYTFKSEQHVEQIFHNYVEAV